MAKIFVSGLINLETTAKVDGFPIPYFPVRYPFFGVRSTVSGVGFNIAKALTVLGNDVRFASMLGSDDAGRLARLALQDIQIDANLIQERLVATPQSVILYDDDGRRQINVDLKDIQDTAYPPAIFRDTMDDCEVLILCNINYNRPFLSQDVMVATDVHTLSDLHDDYNRDFMQNAHILFLSHEHLPAPPHEFIQQLQNRYGAEVIVIGLGSDGVRMAVRADNFNEHIPAHYVRPIVNTIGAGDALFSAFVHSYMQHHDPYIAIQKAQLFAAYKIGESGAATGFLTAAELDALHATI